MATEAEITATEHTEITATEHTEITATEATEITEGRTSVSSVSSVAFFSVAP